MTDYSTKLFARAQTTIPGGVNSPVRAFKNVGGTPIFIKSGNGAYLQDVDGKNYIDYVGSWGPLILGHAHPAVIQAVETALTNGLGFGAPTEIEVTLAELITQLMPSIEQIRMVNSGTEATQSALRLARGFTKRSKIVKFEGCYHGHVDGLLVKGGSGLLTFGNPSSAGIPPELTQQTLVAPFNNLEAVKQLFTQHGEDIAAIIVEPVAGNMNCVLPLPEFLPGLRSICTEFNSLLIFDEVMTGFRVAQGGAQAHYQITPDLTCLGKIIGGGLPVGAFGGRREIMQLLAPIGPVYQAGTLSGNPICLTAGLATLQALQAPGIYDDLAKATEYLIHHLKSLANCYSIPFQTNSIGSMFGIFFTEEKAITHYSQVLKTDMQRFNQFFHAMLAEGVYFAPSAFEAGFISNAHTKTILDKTLEAAERVFNLKLSSPKTKLEHAIPN